MSKALIEHIDFYFNEDGLMVLTENYLRNRGYCCGNGCYNCPFNYENVEERERKILLKLKEDRNKKQ